jgi:tetratricopeptide (TPR) repeat protein
MPTAKVTEEQRRKAEHARARGLQAYREWDVKRAVEHFEAALRATPDDGQVHLDLARALARSGDYDRALEALAGYMRLEPDSPLAQRFEKLFASAMDEVEQLLTSKMTAAGMPIEEVGSAITMWLEYRITLGAEPLNVRKPETWAAALDYTVRKVNLRVVKRAELAAYYGVSEAALRDRHRDLVSVLDVMPCDYRYFTGPDNPLDKLVEAAELLEQLEARFREP